MLAAGDPERANMAKCEAMGGISYHLNVVNFMVRAGAIRDKWPHFEFGVGKHWQ